MRWLPFDKKDRSNGMREKGFASLTKFKTREGHCLVPASHIERKFKLGQWVTILRRTKNKMSAKRRTRLNDIGVVWRAR